MDSPTVFAERRTYAQRLEAPFCKHGHAQIIKTEKPNHNEKAFELFKF
jgi:hypothetical protein